MARLWFLIERRPQDPTLCLFSPFSTCTFQDFTVWGFRFGGFAFRVFYVKKWDPRLSLTRVLGAAFSDESTHPKL